jgi:NAD(P)-dependent dehydrogenase (short-subunit alcohol dehydrogenase family)
MGLLTGQRAIVTGGGSGIGRATCRRMAAEGAVVAVFDRDGESAEKVAGEIGGLAFRVDVTNYAELEAAVEATVREFGGLSLLFNNAGIGGMSELHDYALEEWHRIVDVNLTGVFHGIKAAAPRILSTGGGAIVNTASISGTRPAAGEAPYSAAKAAVVALTVNAAMEYAPSVRVNAVSPGMIRTGLTEPMLRLIPGVAEWMVSKTPLDRIGEPEDIADVVVFLCSDLARFVTGQNLVIDGGMTLHGSGVDGLMARARSVFPKR